MTTTLVDSPEEPVEYEYTVMKQIGSAEPEEASFSTYETFDSAHNSLLDYEHNLRGGGYDGGYSVSTLEEARRVVKALEAAEKTRFFVGRRPKPAEWEECNSWD